MGFWPTVILGLWIGSTFYDFISACRTKRWNYFAKQFINGTRPIAMMVWILYFFILSVQTIPFVNQWALDWVAIHPEQREIIMIAPMMYVLTIIWVACKAFWDMNKPIIKYNEQELIWRKEVKEKERAQLRKLMFWRHESVR